MKLSLLLVLLVIAWCLIDESEGAWRRRRGRRVARRVVRRVFKPICDNVCSVKCKNACVSYVPVCGTICHKVCKGKRSEVSTFIFCPFDLYINISIQFISPFSILSWKVSGSSPLPCDFAAWDKNGDGHVDLEEFSSVASPYVKNRDLALAFQSTDKDGMSINGRYNKLLKRRKFHNALVDVFMFRNLLKQYDKIR